jgi:competence protein ComEC
VDFKKMRKSWMLLIFILFIIYPPSVQSQNLRIHFIDVGEGDSILIQTPKGKAILVDAGNLITGFKVVKYLHENGIQSLECLIFTHPHPDHIGGAFFISQMVNSRKIYDNGQDLSQLAESFDLYRWYEELVRGNESYEVLESGDKFLVDGVRFRIIWPPCPFVFSDFNANSLVVMVEYKKFRCLLAGDLTKAGENELLKRGIDLKADILKVARHGNKDASSEEFLRAISPSISIISVNKNNIRGYPSEEILRRLKDLGVKIYRTDLDGNITITIEDSGRYSIETEK